MSKLRVEIQAIGSRKRVRNRGFTLIELLLVIMILAVTASIVIGVYSNVTLQAERATEASTQGDLLQNLQLFQIKSSGSYPTQFDSLLNDTGAGFYSLLSNALVNGSKKKLVLSTVADVAGTDLSFTSLKSSGVISVMWHSSTASDPSSSGAIVRTLVSGDNVALLDPTTSEGQRIIASIYPAGMPTGVKLIVFGVGPANTSVGVTMVAPPLDPQTSPPAGTAVGTGDIYRRYLAVFAIYSSGSPAQVKTILDRRGMLLGDNLRDYDTANVAQ